VETTSTVPSCSRFARASSATGEPDADRDRPGQFARAAQPRGTDFLVDNVRVEVAPILPPPILE
jgi:hypothetical protein